MLFLLVVLLFVLLVILLVILLVVLLVILLIVLLVILLIVLLLIVFAHYYHFLSDLVLPLFQEIYNRPKLFYQLIFIICILILK